MKKKIIGIAAFICAALGGLLMGCKETEPEPEPKPEPEPEPKSEFAFTLLQDGTYAVSRGDANIAEEIVIPAQYEGRAVTVVAAHAFENASDLKKVTLPASVKRISEYAFGGCGKLGTLVQGDKTLSFFVYNDRYVSEIKGLQVEDYAFSETGFMTIGISDAPLSNDTSVKCTVSGWLDDAVSVTVSSALNSQSEKKVNTISKNETEKQFDFGTYGLFKDVDITVTTEKGSITMNDVPDVGITAPEYNFALLNASYPVLVYTLKLQSITEDGDIPTFVALERNAQYNWDALPYNVKPFPFLAESDAISGDFHGKREKLQSYIKELYELNSDSKFNLYCVDNYGELILEMFVANNIPEENWNAVMITDGNGTSAALSNTFAVDNPETRYAEMKTEWEALKTDVSENGFDAQKISASLSQQHNPEYEILVNYAYVIAREQANVDWWCNRLRAGENLKNINAVEGGEAFITELLTHVTQEYTNSLLAALKPAEQESFKTLYKFNEDMFSDAETNQKEVVMILGTSWSGEEGNLYENVKLLVEFYGTEKYEFYYKGHPGYPTSQYEGRQRYFDELKEEGYVIHELENAIAAEIILFFEPQVNMAGYKTSTFDSITEETNDKALLLFGSKDLFAEATYLKYFDMFASELADEDQGNYNGITFDSGVKYFLLEFNNTEDYANQAANYAKHEIAIYNTDTKAIKYYKLNAGVYSEVDKEGNAVN